MPSEVTDRGSPPLRDDTKHRPADLPHGLLRPPPQVRELLEKERPKHRPEAFAGAEQRLLNEWTVGYYFDCLGHEVIYRATPEGPEILAVGWDEVFALSKALSLEEFSKLEGYLGY